MKQLPSQLESNKRLACTCGQRQQNTLLPIGNSCQHPLYRNVLVIAALPIAAAVFKWHSGKTVSPRVLRRKLAVPQLVWRGERLQLALNTCFHVNAIKALAIARIGKA